jgi:hypothetical protein
MYERMESKKECDRSARHRDGGVEDNEQKRQTERYPERRAGRPRQGLNHRSNVLSCARLTTALAGLGVGWRMETNIGASRAILGPKSTLNVASLPRLLPSSGQLTVCAGTFSLNSLSPSQCQILGIALIGR